ALANAALAQLIAGEVKKALSYYERVAGSLQQWVADALLWTWRFPHALYYADALMRGGSKQRGLALLDEAERLFARLAGEGLVTFELDYERGLVYALRGDYAAAAAAVQRAAGQGWRARWLARREPAFAALRARG